MKGTGFLAVAFIPDHLSMATGMIPFTHIQTDRRP